MTYLNTGTIRAQVDKKQQWTDLLIDNINMCIRNMDGTFYHKLLFKYLTKYMQSFRDLHVV